MGQLQDHYREMRVGLYLVLMIILLACTRGQFEMSESRESRSFGLDIDWNEIYVSNFEPTSYFSNVLQNLVPVLISAVAGLLFGPFYQVCLFMFERFLEIFDHYLHSRALQPVAGLRGRVVTLLLHSFLWREFLGYSGALQTWQRITIGTTPLHNKI